MAQVLEELEQLLRFSGCYHNARRQFPKPVCARRWVSQQSGRIGGIVELHVRGGRADPDAAVATGDVIDQVSEWLRNTGRRVTAQPLEDLGRAPPGVERVTQRIGAEAEDPTGSSRLLLRHQSQVAR